MESIGQVHHQRLQLLDHRFPSLPGHHRRRQPHPPPSIRLHPSRTASTFRRFPSLSVTASSSPPAPRPPPRRGPASLPDLLLAAARPVLISLTAAAAVLLAAPLQRRASSAALAAAAWPQPASTATAAAAAADEAREERELESRLRASPDDTGALRGLMELRVRQRRLPDAVALADRLAALDPTDDDLLLLRAHLRNYAGDPQSSRDAFEEMIRKDPLSVGAYHGLVMLAAQEEDGDVENVMERVEAALSRCREEGKAEEMRDFRLLLAQVKVMEGEFDGALQVYKALVEEEPRDFRPYLCQGVIYSMMEKEDEAEKQFDLYRKLVPKGHPYTQYFDESMTSLMASRQMEGSKRS